MFNLPKIEVSKIPSVTTAVKSTRKIADTTLNSITSKEIQSALAPVANLQFDLAETCAIYYDNAVREFANQYNRYSSTATVTA